MTFFLFGERELFYLEDPFELVDGQHPVHQPRAIFPSDGLRPGPPIRRGDVTNDGFQDVIERHQALKLPILIDHQRNLGPATFEPLQHRQRGDAFCLNP